MWNKLRNHAVYSLILFLGSLILFSAAMPRFGTYLAALCAVEWNCIFLYRRSDNIQFFCRALWMAAGNFLAFALQWFLMGRTVAVSNIDGLELVLLTLLLIGAAYIAFGLLGSYTQQVCRTPETRTDAPALLPERSDDLQRLEGLLKSGAPLIGVNARWGDGKTFMIDHLCTTSQVCDRYEIVRINVLAGNEDEIELTLINEFDRMLRRNRIFSLASKQMLKFLENNDILKQFRWLLIEDTQSVSTTFLRILNDLEKLEKKVLIIVDDLERLGSEMLIRKVFALMESVSSGKVQIIYLFNSAMLTGFDRNYLEKYIPCYMNLTPICFRSIVYALWDELEMEVAKAARKDMGNMMEIPKINSTIMDILVPDLIGGPHAFRLDNVTVRRVRIFMEEFRDLVNLWDTSDAAVFSQYSDVERELLLKCLFIKHFLYDDFERVVIATSLVDSFLFQLNEEAKALLAAFDQQAPDQVTLFYLFDVRRRIDCSEDMRMIMAAILADDGNYNRLLALSMLGFDYTDILRDIQKPKQAAAAAPQSMNPRDNFMLRMEQIGNEDVSSIERRRNNERIDRAMWNLAANGSSEWANLDAYVKHFQRTVLSAAPANQQKAWEQFSSDAWNEKIYKNNTTQHRFAIDAFLPLFQGFRVINTDGEQWLNLLDFYFRQENDISAEMLQNLNYVDMTDHRVYISVLKRFEQCRIIGNLNPEPCMYRFLIQTLRSAFTLGYTRDSLFHSLWYLGNEVPDSKELIPSERWENAVEELVGQFDDMKRILENEKRNAPPIACFHTDIDVIIRFISKCEELFRAIRPLRMRTLQIKMEKSASYSRHQELCDTFRQELQSGMDTDKWLVRLCRAYEDGKLDPSEIRELAALANESNAGDSLNIVCTVDNLKENYLSQADDSFSTTDC